MRVASKNCSKCRTSKEVSEFQRNKARSDGYDHYCKPCRSEDSRQRRERNPEKFRQAYKDWYYNNHDYAKSRVQDYHRKHAEWSRAQRGLRISRSRHAMSELDHSISLEYRKAIANDACFYCGQRAEQMHDDHMNPLSRGGTDHWWNLVRACAPCNLRKGAKTAQEFIEEMSLQ